jgi:hypothetical protein
MPKSRVTASLTRDRWLGESTPSSRLITFDATVSKSSEQYPTDDCVWVRDRLAVEPRPRRSGGSICGTR